MELKLLSLNVADTPVNSSRAKKMKAITDEIKKINPNVIFFQEIVSKSSRAILKTELNKYNFLGNENPKKNGGLEIALDIPYKNPKFVKFFRQAYLNPLSWSDKFLGKGFFSVDLNFKKEKIKIIDVHPVCNYFKSRRGKELLRSQLDQLAEFIRKQKGKLIVSGDFNMISGKDDYKYFLKKSGLVDPLQKEKPQTFNPEAVMFIGRPFSRALYGANKLDYTFVKGFIPSKIFQEVLINKKYFVGEKKKFVSDHYALFTKIKIYSK